MRCLSVSSAADRPEPIRPDSAARACGIPTGGWAPRGWLTEAGPAPWLAEWGLAEPLEGETEAECYRARRPRGVRDCYGALLFGDLASPGSRGLNRDCTLMGKPLVHVQAGLTTPRHIAGFITGISSLETHDRREPGEPGPWDRGVSRAVHAGRLQVAGDHAPSDRTAERGQSDRIVGLEVSHHRPASSPISFNFGFSLWRFGEPPRKFIGVRLDFFLDFSERSFILRDLLLVRWLPR